MQTCASSSSWASPCFVSAWRQLSQTNTHAVSSMRSASTVPTASTPPFFLLLSFFRNGRSSVSRVKRPGPSGIRLNPRFILCGQWDGGQALHLHLAFSDAALTILSYHRMCPVASQRTGLFSCRAMHHCAEGPTWDAPWCRQQASNLYGRLHAPHRPARFCAASTVSPYLHEMVGAPFDALAIRSAIVVPCGPFLQPRVCPPTGPHFALRRLHPHALKMRIGPAARGADGRSRTGA